MNCPQCGGTTKVHKVWHIIRLRRCLSCKYRFKTLEVFFREISGAKESEGK